MRTLKLTMLLVLLTVASPRAMAEDYIGFGCAPWDGATFSIDIGKNGFSLSVSIWQKGFSDLQAGQRTFKIDNRGGSGDVADAIGSAVFKKSGDQSFANVDATVYFSELDLRVGGKARGYVQLPDGTKFPFDAVIPADSLCG